jgi:hypothetical protein
MFGDDKIYEASHYVIFTVSLLLPLLGPNILNISNGWTWVDGNVFRWGNRYWYIALFSDLVLKLLCDLFIPLFYGAVTFSEVIKRGMRYDAIIINKWGGGVPYCTTI